MDFTYVDKPPSATKIFNLISNTNDTTRYQIKYFCVKTYNYDIHFNLQYMDNVLLLINIIQMDGIYINLQQCDNYDNLRSELKYIVLKNINYEFEDISSR